MHKTVHKSSFIYINVVFCAEFFKCLNADWQVSRFVHIYNIAYFLGIVSVGDCELKNQGEYSIVLNILILNTNLNSAVQATVYDIFYRSDNNMWAQKVIDFVTLT